MLDAPLSPLQRFLVSAAAAVVFLWGIRTAAPILNPFLIAIVLAYSLVPIPNLFIRRFGMSRWAAVALTVVVVAATELALIYVVGVSIADFKERLPVYQERFTALYNQVLDLLKAHGVEPSGVSLVKVLTPDRMLALSGSILDAAGGFVSKGLVVLMLMVLLVVEMVEASKAEKARYHEAFRYYGGDVQRYVAITAGTGALNALANLILMLALGVDFPFLWSILYFFMNFIPNVGFFLALLPPALLALVMHGWQRALAVAVGFVLTNAVVDNVVKPLFMKKGMDISLLTVVLSLVFWTFLLGATGAILAIPLTLASKKFVQMRMEGAPVLGFQGDAGSS